MKCYDQRKEWSGWTKLEEKAVSCIFPVPEGMNKGMVIGRPFVDKQEV